MTGTLLARNRPSPCQVPCATAVWLPWPLSALQTHLSGAAASPARHESVVGPPPPREVPLPYALQDKPHPRGYVALQARQPPAIDGQLDEPVWDAAAWSEQFLDIVGPTGGPTPRGPEGRCAVPGRFGQLGGHQCTSVRRKGA